MKSGTGKVGDMLTSLDETYMVKENLIDKLTIIYRYRYLGDSSPLSYPINKI